MTRVLVVLIRVVSWPLTGLITDSLAAAVAALAVVIGIVIWRWRSPDADERTAVRWLGLGLLWTAGFLTVAAASLAVVVPGLPNDHYHAFADPMVFVLVGLGAAAAWRTWRESPDRRPATRCRSSSRASSAWPSSPGTSPTSHHRSHPTAGFPRPPRRRTRIQAATDERAMAIRSLPTFKPADTYGYPLTRDGVRIVPEDETEHARDRLRRALRDGDRRRRAAARRKSAMLRSDPFPATGTGGTGRGALDARPVRGRAWSVRDGLRSALTLEPEKRTPAPQTPAFAVPETRTVEGGPGRALVDAQ